MKYCPRGKAVRTTDDNGNVLISRTRCKQWDCKYCAVINRKQWRARIMNQVEIGQNGDWYFWTVTLKPADHKAQSRTDAIIKSLKVWRNNWDKLMKQVRRDLGKMVYVRVFETHKNGTLHVHMLADKTYDDVQKVVEINSDQSKNIRHNSPKFRAVLLRYGLGVIHDIKPIETPETGNNGIARNVSAYVTKYLTKEVQSDVRQLLRDSGNGRVRMIQTSHGFAKLDVKKEHDWSLAGITELEFWSRNKQGNDVYDIARYIVVTSDDFYEHDHYPNKTSDLVDMAESDEG